MNPKNLQESQHVERKEAFNEKALRTICAFLNTDGGSLFLPIRDNGTILDVPISDKVLQGIVHQIVELLGVQPTISSHDWFKKIFLEINVQKSQIPVHLKGTYYIRVGNTTQRMNPEQLQNRMLDSVAWDSQLLQHASLDDLDHAEIKRFVRSAQENGRLSYDVDEKDTKTILTHAGLMTNNQLTAAAVLLFGNAPQQRFRSAIIRFGVFASESEILNDKFVEGHLFHQFRAFDDVFRANIVRGYTIPSDSFVRKENWEYPLAAVREAILNAIIHRNYQLYGTEIQVKLFPDKLTIFSPGGLPAGVDVDQLLNGHPSVKRNKLIADIFYRAGLIEAFGTGFSRMNEALDSEGFPKPVLADHGYTFELTFHKSVKSG